MTHETTITIDTIPTAEEFLGEDLITLKEWATTASELYNELTTSETRNYKFEAALDEGIRNAVNAYTAISLKLYINVLGKANMSESEKLIQAACEWVYDTIRIKDTKDSVTGLSTREIIDTKKTIPFTTLEKRLKNRKIGFGADSTWHHMITKFGYLYCIKKAKSIQADPEKIMELKDCYAIKQIARDVELGKNPVCEKNIMETFQKVIDAMVGEGVVTVDLADEEFIDNAYAKYGKGVLTASTDKQLVEIFMRVVRRHLDGVSYEIQAKLDKKNK